MSDSQEKLIEEHQQLIADFKTVAKTDSGVNVLKDLSRFCLENAMTFDISSERLTSFNEGKRQVIRYIREKLADSGEPRQKEVITDSGE